MEVGEHGKVVDIQQQQTHKKKAESNLEWEARKHKDEIILFVLTAYSFFVSIFFSKKKGRERNGDCVREKEQ